KVLCYFCDQKGHFKSECPERASWEAMKVEKAGIKEVKAGLAQSGGEAAVEEVIDVSGLDGEAW
ncbi:hypothetical protein BKA93DRAFT_732599, partial [Sparassis latifolia]